MSTKYRVLVADSIAAKGIDLLSSHPQIETVVKTGMKEDDIVKIVADFDAVIVRSQTKITARIMKTAHRLKVIGRAGVGVDNIDVEAATERGVIVMNTPGGNTISTAEHAFSLLMSLSRNIPQAHASMREGKWDRKSFEGVELCNKTLGIIGMGRIGTEVSRRANGFGMRVLAFDPYLTLNRAKSLQVELCEQLEPLLKAADFITLHTPLTPETQGILNKKTLALCKKGVRIINCARGGLVTESDLADAVKSGHVAAAALDVFEKEPLPTDSPLRQLPQLVLTPHLGASTFEAQESVGIEVAEQIRDALIDGAIRNAVNMPNMDARTAAFLRPYIKLGVRMGRLLTQLAPKRMEGLLIHYTGKVNEHDTTPITRAILKGLLTNVGGNEVNEINAPRFAESLGLKVQETKDSTPCDFAELIRAEVVADHTTYEVSATLFGNRPRIVSVNGYALEAMPDGILFIMENRDRPGIVGWIGTLLGKHKVNIASMSLSRTEPGSHALSILNLDTAPDDATLEEIRKDKDIFSVKVVSL